MVSSGRRGRRHDQQRRHAAAVRRRDLPEPGHGRVHRRDDPVLRREGHDGRVRLPTVRRLVLRDGLPTSITTAPSQQTGVATFSSGGPRNGDGVLKPDISAPGSPIISTFVGSGNRQESLSGTSMASPHIAGIAALVQQLHPKWKPDRVKAAIINTGNPADIAGYAARSAGSGFVNAAAAARTQVTAAADRQADERELRRRRVPEGREPEPDDLAPQRRQDRRHVQRDDGRAAGLAACTDAEQVAGQGQGGQRRRRQGDGQRAGRERGQFRRVPRRRGPCRVHAGVGDRQRRRHAARAVLHGAARVVEREREARQAVQGHQPVRDGRP